MKQKLFLLAALVFAFAACNNDEPSDPTITHKSRIEGCLSGLFSISPTEQVYFSKGNLQWRKNGASDVDGTWTFAVTQYLVLGEEDNEARTGTFLKFDLFGWGTGDNPRIATTKTSDYATFVDWGKNPIYNGGNEANLWRTLTAKEWTYLLMGRKEADRKFALGHIYLDDAKADSINGLFILPDTWTKPAGIVFNLSINEGLKKENNDYHNSSRTNFKHNGFTLDDWSKLEAAGVVFLPAAGDRFSTNVNYVGSRAYYWSDTPFTEDLSLQMFFDLEDLRPQTNYNRSIGCAVRLVR